MQIYFTQAMPRNPTGMQHGIPFREIWLSACRQPPSFVVPISRNRGAPLYILHLIPLLHRFEFSGGLDFYHFSNVFNSKKREALVGKKQSQAFPALYMKGTYAYATGGFLANIET